MENCFVFVPPSISSKLVTSHGFMDKFVDINTV